MIDYAAIMTQAAMLRKRLGEDNSSPVDIFALALSIEMLTLVLYPLGENLSGMCVKGGAGNKLIAVNSGMTLGRQRFSLAHELYHLYYDESMMSICSKRIGDGADVERSANAFASYFLMPDAALHELAAALSAKNPSGGLLLDDVIHIEQYFGVSHQATVYRLMHTHFLSRVNGQTLLGQTVRARAELIGYSPDLYRPTPLERQFVTYGSYINLVDRAMSCGLISQGKYEELLMDAFRADLVYGDGEEEGDMVD